MYPVERNSVFIALVATSFGPYSHKQASAIQNLKKPGYMYCIKMSTFMGSHLLLLLLLVVVVVVVVVVLLLLNAVELSLGGSSPYTSRDKTNRNTYT
jgi:uncharacterized membrane protein